MITALLVAERRQRGRVDLKDFWLRRARRLLLALYLLLVVTLAYAVVFLPGEVAGLRGDEISALSYVTNWYLIFGNGSYFEADGRPSLLRHLWSLAVEEQFYLLWPPILVLGVSLGARRYRLRRLIVVAPSMAVVSAVSMAFLYAPNVDPSRIYYGTDTRVSGLLIGAALAFVWGPADRGAPGTCFRLRRINGLRPIVKLRRRYGWTTPLILDVAGVAALAALAVMCLRVNEFQPFLYGGGFVLVSLATAVLIAVVSHPRSRVGSVILGWAPLRWVGERSYGIYLWHWPVYMVTRQGLDVPLDGPPLFALRVAVTVLLAYLSYRFVETPVRAGALGRALRRLRASRGPERRALHLRWAAATAPVLAVCVVLGVAVARAEAPKPPSYLETRAIHTTGPPLPHPADHERAGEPEKVGSTKMREYLATAPPPEKPRASSEKDAGGSGQDNAPAEEKAAKNERGSKNAVAAPMGPVSATGDSALLGSAGALQKQVDELSVVDAEVGVQVPYAIDILRSRRDAGQLGETVIVHLGDNGTFAGGQFDALIRVLSDVERVVFVNVRVPRAWETPNNEVIRAGVARRPNAELVDRYSASAGRPNLFVTDGVHLQPPGQKLYASMISARIERE